MYNRSPAHCTSETPCHNVSHESDSEKPEKKEKPEEPDTTEENQNQFGFGHSTQEEMDDIFAQDEFGFGAETQTEIERIFCDDSTFYQGTENPYSNAINEIQLNLGDALDRIHKEDYNDFD